MSAIETLPRRTFLRVAVLGAAAVTLAACQPGATTPQSTGAAPASTTQAASAPGTGGGTAGGQAPTANIGNTTSTVNFALQSLITQQGLFDKFGVNATTNNVQDGQLLTSSVVSGATDIALLTGVSQVFQAIEAGAGLKLIAGCQVGANLVLYTAKPDINNPKDLEGRSVGTGPIGALLHQIAVLSLQSLNVDVSKVQFVNIGSSIDVYKAIVAGKVDAGPSSALYMLDPAKWGVRVLADSAKALPKYVTQAAYTSDKAIADKRDALVRVLAAYGAAFKLANDQSAKETYMHAYESGNSNAPEDEADAQWQAIHLQPDYYNAKLVLTDDLLTYMQQINVDFGAQKGIVPVAKVSDMSLAQDAAKLLAA
jgi:ABC-type nitrate/sulfonate/bicarbonate transport system substrate-binding protein